MLGAKVRTAGPPTARLVALTTGALAMLGLVASSPSCKGETPSPSPSGSAHVELAPVGAPAGLVATFVVRDPDVALAAARDLLGSRGGFLESRDRVGRLAVDLGMPATTLDLYADKTPIVVAVTSGGAASPPSFAFALEVKDPTSLLSSTTFGAAPPFTDKRLETGDVLSPSAGQALPFAIGLFGRHLVFASDGAALVALGPFLDRTLARGPSSAEPGGTVSGEVDGTLLASLIEDVLAKRLSTLPIGVRLALDSGSLTTPLRSAGKVALSATISSAHLAVAARVPVADGPTPFGLARGPRSAALAVPPGAQVALTVYEGPASRAASAESVAKTMVAILSKDDASAVAKALGDLARARADRSTLSFEIGPKGPSLFGDLAVDDGLGAQRALDALVEAVDARSLRAAVHDAGFKLGVKKTVLERVGDVVRLRVARVEEPAARAGAGDPPPNIDLFLRLEHTRLVLGAGYDGPDALARALADARPLPWPARAPDELSLALFVDPSRLRDPRAIPSTALLTLDVDAVARVMTASLDLDAVAVSALLDVGLTH